MTSINSLVHHIDQLVTQHRVLQTGQIQLQNRIIELEHQLLQQQQTAVALAKEKPIALEASQNEAFETELTQLIGLFDQATEAHHD